MSTYRYEYPRCIPMGGNTHRVYPPISYIPYLWGSDPYLWVPLTYGYTYGYPYPHPNMPYLYPILTPYLVPYP